MAKVQVAVLNNSGNTVTLTLDDERDAERIEYFRTLKRREDIADVTVSGGAKAPRSQQKSSGDAGGTGNAG
ncbi:hypothetical protein [Mycobacterium sp. CnD-18-1]|uniref:hypothetical protein n=1 Tax=Mycobacterium sp. CnD-18-1 TaxID=2917744 RepID=UPI001EF392D7|nr:hypothetical protein [Mycobacterium sp. CnD-18-1]MCG7610348.1 hypothetical protein [Mycobacterium sp. CnD-18-1]